MFCRAGFRAKRLRHLNKNLVLIGSKYLHCFTDELIQRHGLFGLLAIHQLRAHPGRRNLKYPDAAFPKEKSLRENI